VSAWSVHLPTAGETCVRVCLRPREAGDPWPFSLVLTELARLGAVGEGRFRALGSGHGEPLLAAQELRWRRCPAHLETLVGRDGRREAALSLPSWDEMCTQAEATEEDFWDLVDGFAAAVDAEHGAIVDGEPLELEAPREPRGWEPVLARHLAVLVPVGLAGAVPAGRAAHYRDLSHSGLAVLLR
jgi:hypothetical protein